MKDDQFERRLLELVSNASERDKKALFAMLTESHRVWWRLVC